MRWFNYWLRNNLGFSKTESNGVLILIPFLFAIIISPYVYRNYKAKNNEVWHDKGKSDSLLALLEIKIEDKQKRITNYKKNWYKEEKTSSYSSTRNKSIKKYPNTASSIKKEELVFVKAFDINKADTAQLQKVYGIGPVLSQRIIKYRDLIGGFVTTDQYREVYGLEDSIATLLINKSYIAKEFNPKKLNINNLNSYILDDHPYITKKMAKAIDAYRYQHGPFQSLSELHDIVTLDSALLKRITPYLEL